MPSGTQPVMFAWVIGETVINAVVVPHEGIFAPLGSVGENTVGIFVGFEPLTSPPPQAMARDRMRTAGSVTTVLRIADGFEERRMRSE